MQKTIFEPCWKDNTTLEYHWDLEFMLPDVFVIEILTKGSLDFISR